MKPFRAYLAEQEQDYEYKLCSVENIHTDEMVQKIHLALDRYGLISLEPKGVQTTAKDTANNQFSEYPFMSVFVSTVVLANPLSSDAAVQSIALFTRIKDKKIQFFDKDDKIVMDGADAEQHAHPVEVDSTGAQEEVGDLRAKSLISDVMKDIIARREATTIEREVYEGFVASHHEIATILGQSVARGFYLGERFDDDTGLITGPFDKCPDNYDYVGPLREAVVVETTDRGELFEYAVEYAPSEAQNDPEDGGQRDVGKSMSVEIVDQDSGKTHSIVVRATSNNAARAKAIEVMASRTGLSKERYMATNPKPE